MRKIGSPKIPPIKLDYLRALTDDTGIIQHTKFATPNRREGYTTDDNARALIACTKYHHIHSDPKIARLAGIYLGFLYHMQMTDGRFHNFLSYDRHFLDNVGSEDCMGRALWACGYAMKSNLDREKKLVSKEVFDKGLPHVHNFRSPRAKAFAILGLSYYQQAYLEDQNLTLNMIRLVDQLLNNYKNESSGDWHWFEPYLTYSNARLTQALFEAYRNTKKEEYCQIAEESLGFLVENQMVNDEFVPIGNNGWFPRGGRKALYDQQSIEASCMTEAALTALQTTGDEEYRRTAYTIFEWYLGRNPQKVMVYNLETGGCYDGITPSGVNLNQGAEATVAYLLARLELELSE
ncbi:MAG: glycosyltransferase [Candidatus Bathyarchaeota archaeon]|nr:glycosyltransferase [Candidatus Bathyarchaeota archaeon]